MSATPVDDGGPAFPRLLESGGVRPVAPGMTLRDYFAAQAMQGLLASKPNGWMPHILVAEAFKIADAMLKARQS